MSTVYTPEYGDNIFEIGARCGRVLRASGWSQAKINSLHEEARKGNYDHAVEVYGRFITIRKD